MRNSKASRDDPSKSMLKNSVIGLLYHLYRTATNAQLLPYSDACQFPRRHISPASVVASKEGASHAHLLQDTLASNSTVLYYS